MALWAGENNVDSVDVPKEALELTGLGASPTAKCLCDCELFTSIGTWLIGVDAIVTT